MRLPARSGVKSRAVARVHTSCVMVCFPPPQDSMTPFTPRAFKGDGYFESSKTFRFSRAISRWGWSGATLRSRISIARR